MKIKYLTYRLKKIFDRVSLKVAYVIAVLASFLLILLLSVLIRLRSYCVVIETEPNDLLKTIYFHLCTYYWRVIWKSRAGLSVKLLIITAFRKFSDSISLMGINL